jgi:hypothetical protein
MTMRKTPKTQSRPLLWHIYHTILAVELALVVIIQLISLIHHW